MLSTYTWPRVIRDQTRLSQCLRISIKFSSSSDSESDSDAKQKKSMRKLNKDTEKRNKDTDKLQNLLLEMMQQKQVKNKLNINVAMKQKEESRRDKENYTNQKLSFTEQLTQAAKNAAENFDVNKKSIASELINKYSQTERYKRPNNHQEKNARSVDSHNTYIIPKMITFKDNYQHTVDTPVLKIWNELQEKQVSMMVMHYPNNACQEMIQWTQEGKLWKFPIDNYQGMEEEEKVHFSEHVFMERHLKGWVPKRGPVRHFMELVCVGLSKNPYMTVQEKIDHIMWYKNYFDGKKVLLERLGAIELRESGTTKGIKVE